jgi:hypothetical protein
MKKLRPKMNKYQRRAMQAEKLKLDLHGSGIYVYENNTDGDLTLPKATASGLKVISPRKRFQGDSYFMKWVGNPMNLLKLVEVIQPENSTKEEEMTEKHLILDQPDTITQQGKIERVMVEPNAKPINDSATNELPKKTEEILISENPLDGIEIIVD